MSGDKVQKVDPPPDIMLICSSFTSIYRILCSRVDSSPGTARAQFAQRELGALGANTPGSFYFPYR